MLVDKICWSPVTFKNCLGYLLTAFSSPFVVETIVAVFMEVGELFKLVEADWLELN